MILDKLYALKISFTCTILALGQVIIPKCPPPNGNWCDPSYLHYTCVGNKINKTIFNSLVKHLECLDVNSHGIKSLSDDSFVGYSFLQFLDISNNSILMLPPNLFNESYSLRALSMANNKIRSVPNGLFDNTKLVFLDLRNNRLVTLPPNLGVDIHKVLLTGNRLHFLPPDVFDEPQIKGGLYIECDPCISCDCLHVGIDDLLYQLPYSLVRCFDDMDGDRTEIFFCSDNQFITLYSPGEDNPRCLCPTVTSLDPTTFATELLILSKEPTNITGETTDSIILSTDATLSGIVTTFVVASCGLLIGSVAVLAMIHALYGSMSTIGSIPKKETNESGNKNSEGIIDFIVQVEPYCNVINNHFLNFPPEGYQIYL